MFVNVGVTKQEMSRGNKQKKKFNNTVDNGFYKQYKKFFLIYVEKLLNTDAVNNIETHSLIIEYIEAIIKKIEFNVDKTKTISFVNLTSIMTDIYKDKDMALERKQCILEVLIIFYYRFMEIQRIYAVSQGAEIKSNSYRIQLYLKILNMID